MAGSVCDVGGVSPAGLFPPNTEGFECLSLARKLVRQRDIPSKRSVRIPNALFGDCR
mgnify:CR=1 FL=1